MSSISHVLTAIRAHYPDYHPLVSIANIAHSTIDKRLEFDCHRVIAKYVEPELKSLEVKGSFSESRRVSVSLFSEDIVDAVVVEQKQLVKLDEAVDGY